MAYTDIHPEISKDAQPFFSLLKFLASVLIAFSITFAFIIILKLTGLIDPFALSEVTINSPNAQELKFEILLIQFIFSFGLFILSPILYVFLYEKKSLSVFNVPDRLNLIAVLLTVFIVIAFMPINSWFIYLNQEMDLPNFLSGFEEWAKEKEESAKNLTELITDIRTPLEFIFAFLVIAVSAGIGEELLFRGVIQNKLFALLKNPHLAIWTTAFIFSAIHMQFYGFFPRMFLGALFGYLYYWSKNLMIPIIAHFINNGVTVTAVYLYHSKVTDINVEEPSPVPVNMAITALVVSSGLVYSFWRLYQEKDKPETKPWENIE